MLKIFGVELLQCWIGWLCLTSHQQQGHIEPAPPFTVPCEIHRSDWELNPGPSHGSPFVTAALRNNVGKIYLLKS